MIELCSATPPTSTGEAVAFWVLAPIAVIAAVMIVLSRKAVHSALWMATTMIMLAVLYIMQGGVFLGVVQVVVYTGAVMMLFLFVLMLVGVDASDSFVETLRGQRVVGDPARRPGFGAAGGRRNQSASFRSHVWRRGRQRRGRRTRRGDRRGDLHAGTSSPSRSSASC